ncbi:hypothetical protein KUV75_03175 [Qipengyuania gaetbuli]|uniref:hypothetical protein n=1 Tax=Qipengyuania gaetbuli TaxID=266952 RepID=UPI001C992EEE|nr:hypothetical protein [Qipengyuania gaetbuli]MBY6013906.1 hypothetical protein [Qipengyuania gaetbuli]
MTTGREYLNRETRGEHNAVEAAFDTLDMATGEGMDAILTAHIGAMDRLLPALSDHPAYRDEIARLRSLASLSRDALDLPERADTPRQAAALHPLAIAYVVLGSRLGARVISRRLDRQAVRWSDDVRGYFTDEGSGPAWAKLCEELETGHSDAELADIADDAQRVFALYGEEARALSPAPSMANA